MGLERGIAWDHPCLAARGQSHCPTRAGKSRGGAGAEHPPAGRGADSRDAAGLYLRQEGAISASPSKRRNLNPFLGIHGTCTPHCPDVKDNLN